MRHFFASVLPRGLAGVLLAVLFLAGGSVAPAEDTVVVTATPAPTPDPEKGARRALAARLGAMSDEDYTAYLQAHPEARSALMIAPLLEYAFQAGANGGAEEARALARANEMAKALNDAVGLARVRWTMANIEARHNRLDKAIATYGEALDMAEAAHAPDRQIAGVLSARIIALVRKGDYARAMEDCSQALRLSTEANYQDGAMATLCALANIYQRQGQPAQALPYLEQARRWAGDDARFLVFVDDNYGEVYRLLDQPEKAREYLERALVSARKVGDGELLTGILNANAALAYEVKDYAAARRMLIESLAVAEKINDPSDRDEAREELAEVAEKEGRHDEAEALARQVAVGAEVTGEREPAWKAQNLLGRALAAQGKTPEALAAFRGAVAIIEGIRAGAAGDEESSQAVLQKRVEPYRKLTQLLAAAGQADEAFATAENAKARVLRDILQHGRMDLTSALTDDERQRRAASGEKIARLNRQLQEARSTGKDAASKTKSQDELDAARVEARNLDNALLAAHPEVRRRQVSGSTTEPPLAPGDLCDADTVLLEYAVGPDAVTLFAAGPAAAPLTAYPLAVNEDELRAWVGSFRQALADRSLGWKEAADKLGPLLLAPVKEKLSRAKRVVIIPDGPLWDLPFQVLGVERGGGCLIDRSAVSYAPSAGFLARVRREGRGMAASEPGKAPTETRLLAMGNPALGGDAQKNPAALLMGDAFAPLPAAEDEVRTLGKMYGEGQEDIFLGDRAREDVFKREAPRCDILHLATHGLLNDTNPLYSCLLMAQTNLAPGEDGLLEAREIMQLHLHARLAVLAACETARGKAGAGEGQLGLSWALLVAGCPASVVSQWKVDSQSNVDLMVELHRQLRGGQPPDEALRQASLALRKKPGYENPFYWAPFVVVGDGG